MRLNYLFFPLLFSLTFLCTSNLYAQPETSETFNFIEGQMQTFVVPPGVTSVHIEAVGASGGDVDAVFGFAPGGLGAKISGSFAVSPGEMLQIIVGGEGKPGVETTGGGGGGTGVVKGGMPLIIAGGGAGVEFVDADYPGKHASTTEDAFDGQSASPSFNPPGLGGSGGADGGVAIFPSKGNIARGGKGFSSSPMGSVGDDPLLNNGNGSPGSWGLGGGGGSVDNGGCNCSGGGGGYSGGGAGGVNGSGGGGGSFNAGDNPVAVAMANDGDGYVIITYTEGTVATNFILVDAKTDQDIGPLTAGQTIDMCELGDDLAIRFEPDASQTVESVYMTGAGLTRTENKAPYALAGNSGSNYYEVDMDPGQSYTFTATPYSEDNEGGTAYPTETVTVNVIQSLAEVTSFVLEDVLTGAKTPLTDGMVIDINFFSKDFNIEAIVSPNPAGCNEESVVLDLTGSNPTSRTESTAPYELAGSNSVHEFTLGNYTLSATTYEKNGARGAMGPTTTINFEVVCTPCDLEERQGSVVRLDAINVYPNPASQSILLDVSGTLVGESTVKVMDSKGSLMIQKVFSEQQGAFTQKLSVADFPAGIYHLTLVNGNLLYQKSFVKK